MPEARYSIGRMITDDQEREEMEALMSRMDDSKVLMRFIERGRTNPSPVEKALYEKLVYEMKHPEEIQTKPCPVEGCDARVEHDRMMCSGHWRGLSNDRKSALMRQIDLAFAHNALPEDIDVFEQMVRIAAKTVR